MKTATFLAAAAANAGLCLASLNGTTPMQTRIAYAGTSGMRVSWNTYDKIEFPTVFYGESPDLLIWPAISNESTTYETSTTWNNHVKLTGLRPNTKYYYRILGCDESTEPYSFVTSRSAGDLTPFQVAVVVDLGTMGQLGLSTSVGKGAANPLAPGERNTIQALEAASPNFDFLWHRKLTGHPRRMFLY
jgi:hypothetical protein